MHKRHSLEIQLKAFKLKEIKNKDFFKHLKGAIF